MWTRHMYNVRMEWVLVKPYELATLVIVLVLAAFGVLALLGFGIEPTIRDVYGFALLILAATIAQSLRN